MTAKNIGIPIVMAILLAVIFSGCSPAEKPELVYNVPTEIQPIIDLFIEEAGIRGNNIEINNLIVRYDSSMNNSQCGLCNSNSTDPEIQKIISLNPKKCWENEYQLEALIFHELGHCVLARFHTSELMPNGDPKSMMIANDISIYSPCIYDIGNGDCNQLFKRTYYLDELFDESTPVPDWAK